MKKDVSARMVMVVILIITTAFVLRWTWDESPIVSMAIGAAVEAVVFTPDGHAVVVGTDEGAVELWSLSNTRLWSKKVHTEAVTALAVSQDGRRIASSGYDGRIQVSDVDTGKLIGSFVGMNRAMLTVALNHDATLLAAGGFHETLQLWDLRTGRSLVARTQPSRRSIVSIRWNDQEQRLFVAHDTEQQFCWDIVAGTRIQPCRDYPQHPYNDHLSVVAILDSSGHRMASTAAGQVELFLWKAQAPNVEHILTDHWTDIWGLAFSADGQWLASGGGRSINESNNRSPIDVCLWRVSDGSLHARFLGHTADVVALAFRADGQLLASAGKDGSVKLWRIHA